MNKNQINKQINDYILSLKDSINIKEIMPTIAALISSAIDKNFDLGGRWDGKGTDFFSGGNKRWTTRARSTLSNYSKTKRGIRPTLKRSGTLYRQIEVLPYGNQIKISVNSPYAAIHQYGGMIKHPGGTSYIVTGDGLAKFISNKKAKELDVKGRQIKKTKPHNIYIPPRPYLTITPEDLKEIEEILKSKLKF